VKAWRAALWALLLWIPCGARAADGAEAAARELARKAAAFAGEGEPLGLEWRNISSLGAAESGRIRAAFEASLQQAGGRVSEIAPVASARVTVSEDPGRFFLVEEARKGDQRQVWISAWPRPSNQTSAPPATLEKKLMWEQEEQILDTVFPGEAMLLLTPSNLVWFSRQEGRWARALSVPLPSIRPWPRDPRGRLRVNGANLQAYLPGVACTGAWQPPVAVECKASDAAWVLESGGHAMLAANFAVNRNYFEGRVTTQTGVRKTVAPFYSAAAVEEDGKPLWALAALDGHARLYDAAFNPAGEIEGWGSDVAGVEARCGANFQVLATRAGNGETDAVQAFSVDGRAASPLTAPVELPGPVTALWSAGGASALAVSHNLSTGKYAAYLLTVTCGK
jgi:hypothetical protein